MSMNISTSKSGGSVTIDGRTFTGRSIRISGNSVIVDGIEQSGDLVGNITVTVSGDCESIKTQSGDVNIQGSANIVSTMSGDVTAQSITSSISTMSGDVIGS